MQLEEMNHDERSGLLKVSVSSVMRAAGTCIDVHVCGLNTYTAKREGYPRKVTIIEYVVLLCDAKH